MRRHICIHAFTGKTNSMHLISVNIIGMCHKYAGIYLMTYDLICMWNKYAGMHLTSAHMIRKYCQYAGMHLVLASIIRSWTKYAGCIWYQLTWLGVTQICRDVLDISYNDKEQTQLCRYMFYLAGMFIKWYKYTRTYLISAVMIWKWSTGKEIFWYSNIIRNWYSYAGRYFHVSL